MIEILALRARTLRSNTALEHYVRIGQTLVFEYTHCNSGIRILSVYSDHTFEHLQCTSHVRLRSILSCQAIEKMSEFDRGIRDEKMHVSFLTTEILLLKDLILGCLLSFFVPVFERRVDRLILFLVSDRVARTNSSTLLRTTPEPPQNAPPVP